MTLNEILDNAIAFAAQRADHKARQVMGEILNQLNSILDDATMAQPGAGALQLVTVLQKHGSPQQLESTNAYLRAMEVLKDLKKKLLENPEAPVNFEFMVGRHGEDYQVEGAHDTNHVIIEERVSGKTGVLLGVLRAAGALIEWQPRTNGFKASFCIRAN